MKKSRGVLSEKEKLSLLVKEIAMKCTSLSELAEKLRENSLLVYYRNHILTGVWLGNRKFRLTTLGIDKSHLKELKMEQDRLDKLKESRYTQDKEQGLEP